MMTEALGFELYLMSYMRGEAKVAASLASLGISSEAMRDAARHVDPTLGFMLAVHKFDAYTRILGDPVETIPEPESAPESSYGGSLRHRFHVSIWPDLDLVIRTHPSGWAWGPEFVRRLGAPAPAVARPQDLEPWSIVESEVVARFGPFADESAWDFGKDASYFVEQAGAYVEIELTFDLALLQRIEVRPRAKRPGDARALPGR